MGRCAIRKVNDDTIRVGMRTATGDYHSLLFDADQLRDLYESLHEFVLGTTPNTTKGAMRRITPSNNDVA